MKETVPLKSLLRASGFRVAVALAAMSSVGCDTSETEADAELAFEFYAGTTIVTDPATDPITQDEVDDAIEFLTENDGNDYACLLFKGADGNLTDDDFYYCGCTSMGQSGDTGVGMRTLWLCDEFMVSPVDANGDIGIGRPSDSDEDNNFYFDVDLATGEPIVPPPENCKQGGCHEDNMYMPGGELPDDAPPF